MHLLKLIEVHSDPRISVNAAPKILEMELIMKDRSSLKGFSHLKSMLILFVLRFKKLSIDGATYNKHRLIFGFSRNLSKKFRFGLPD